MKSPFRVKNTPAPERSDEDLARDLRETVERACELKDQLTQRGWGVSIFFRWHHDEKSTVTVDIGRRHNL